MRVYVKSKDKPKIEMSLDEINKKLNAGLLDGDELGWKAGLTDWTLLRNIEGVVMPTPPPLPDESIEMKKLVDHQYKKFSPNKYIVNDASHATSHPMILPNDITKERKEKNKTALDNMVRCPICHKNVKPIIDESENTPHCPKCGYYGNNFLSQEMQSSSRNKTSSSNIASSKNETTPDTQKYGGIGRLIYFCLWLILSFAYGFLTASLDTFDISEDSVIYISILFLMYVMSMTIVYYRLRNVGMNPIWTLIMLIPIVNILMTVRCLVVPEGYADSKKLDFAGKVITAVVLSTLFFVVSALIAQSL